MKEKKENRLENKNRKTSHERIDFLEHLHG